jgi:hypothetical protein
MANCLARHLGHVSISVDGAQFLSVGAFCICGDIGNGSAVQIGSPERFIKRCSSLEIMTWFLAFLPRSIDHAIPSASTTTAQIKSRNVNRMA